MKLNNIDHLKCFALKKESHCSEDDDMIEIKSEDEEENDSPTYPKK